MLWKFKFQENMRCGRLAGLMMAYCLSYLRGRKVYSLFLESEVRSLVYLIKQVKDCSNSHMFHVMLFLLEIDVCEKQNLEQIVQFYCIISLLDTFGTTEELLLWAEQCKIRCRSFSNHSLYSSIDCDALTQNYFVRLETSMDQYDQFRLNTSSNIGFEADRIIFGLNESSNFNPSIPGKAALIIRLSVQSEYQMFTSAILPWMRKYSMKTMRAMIISSIQHSHNTSKFMSFLIKVGVKVIFVSKNYK
ncbi:unnamed protein product [Phytomonas sp. Hart1]|nr:unnamed protein product [Phytomonas sp. Hart1]|eukprot:CCW70454.1 unnamed protein product [Phytomonas sp. isolate Hart1]